MTCLINQQRWLSLLCLFVSVCLLFQAGCSEESTTVDAAAGRSANEILADQPYSDAAGEESFAEQKLTEDASAHAVAGMDPINEAEESEQGDPGTMGEVIAERQAEAGNIQMGVQVAETRGKKMQSLPPESLAEAGPGLEGFPESSMDELSGDGGGGVGGGGGLGGLGGGGGGFFGSGTDPAGVAKNELGESSAPASGGKRKLMYRRLDEKLDEGRSGNSARNRRIDIQPGEELWVIARSSADSSRPSDVPGCGSLMAIRPGQTKQVPVPLKHTAVEGQIDGYIASVNVQQQFHNPWDSKIEAVYVFPLPQNAAVNEFVMTIGDRKIRGIIREREKAEKIYAAARSQGHVASLMTQERPNIFTQKVANIEPGRQIDIDVRYFNTLQYDNGSYVFTFPMVVGPRFNPAVGDGVGAVPRGAVGTSGQSTELQYLAPHERTGHDISMNLTIDAGVPIEDIHCVNHAIDVTDTSATQKTVTLGTQETIPNKDFVLKYQVASEQIKTAMLTHEDDHGQYFTMMVYPPKSLQHVQRSPMEMVFVLDCSGSMRGQPMTQAKAAVAHALQSLTERDTFQIIRFSSNASQLGNAPVQATEDNIRAGLAYLNSLSGSGGTQMIEGIKAALDFPHDEGRFRLVSFMTDGYIGNEQQILTTLNRKLGASRIFSFGVGSSPNRYLMDRMAVLGKGAVAYLSLNDDAVKIMDRFNQRISHPAMTDLQIDWGDMQVQDVFPSRLPDLIVDRPITVTGRFTGQPSVVKVNGRVDMEAASLTVKVDQEEATAKHEGIAAVWARMKIKDLMLQQAAAPETAGDVQKAVTETALAYNLMSRFTSFVAVDSMTKTEGRFGTTVTVPVNLPDGVRYDTTVGGDHQ